MEKNENLKRINVIGENEINKANEILKKYKDGKKNLEQRIIDNEQWWKIRHWEQIRGETENKDPEPSSAWLFNSIANKHADFMDNFPEPIILPREESDKMTAQVLSDVVPCIMEQNGYEKTYSDTCWYKLKAGTGVYGVFWNSEKENGIGDVDIRQMDILSLFWEPGIKNIQESKNVFSVQLVDNEVLEGKYEFLKGTLSKGEDGQLAKYYYDDEVDTSEKSLVVDWYYKKTIRNGLTVREVLHYCKYVGNHVLYATENNADTAITGLYDHGQYPFIFDVMFQEEGTPTGFGYIDTMKDCQMYIDKMNQVIIKNALAAARPRYFVRDTAGLNIDDLMDLSNDIVKVTGNISEEFIRPIQTTPLNGAYLQVLQNKIDELKETSGNRDFSQGSTTSGVTAASAIAALQEAGSKLSRDMIKNTYNAYSEIVKLVIELIRQFYTVPRVFRITGNDGVQNFVSFDNRGMNIAGGEEYGLDIGNRVPVFDIKISAQKASPFTRISQNEFAKELYNLGFFNPQLSDQALSCIEMMDFDGKEEVRRRIEENGTMYQQIQQMQQQMQMMAQVIAESTGDSRLVEAVALHAGAPNARIAGNGNIKKNEQQEPDILGNTKENLNATAGKARTKAARAATPK